MAEEHIEIFIQSVPILKPAWFCVKNSWPKDAIIRDINNCIVLCFV